MRVFLFSMILLLVSCTVSEQAIKKNVVDSKEISFVNLKKQFHKGEEINLVFENNLESSITIFNPQRILIEKNIDNKWDKVKILYCPCGASCPQPPEQLVLMPSQKHIFYWNQNENWCGEYIAKFVQKTETKFAGYGKYRMRIYCKIEENKIVDLYKYFEIIE